MMRVIFSLCIVLALSGIVFAQPNLPAPVDLPIRNIPQETNVWCWAAVAQQIIHARLGPQRTPPQCALVAIANGASPQACCSGPNPQCVRTGSLDQIRMLIHHFGLSFSSYAPPTDPMTLYNTLRSGRAVILQVQTGFMAYHVVVLRGMFFQMTPNGPMPMLMINDPLSYFNPACPVFPIGPYLAKRDCCSTTVAIYLK